MGSPGIDLFGISHVKVDLIPVLKMYVLPMLEIFDLNYRICTMCPLLDIYVVEGVPIQMFIIELSHKLD